MGNRHDMWPINSNAFWLELECCQKRFNNLLYFSELYFSESKKMEQKFAEGCGTCVESERNAGAIRTTYFLPGPKKGARFTPFTYHDQSDTDLLELRGIGAGQAGLQADLCHIGSVLYCDSETLLTLVYPSRISATDGKIKGIVWPCAPTRAEDVKSYWRFLAI